MRKRNTMFVPKTNDGIKFCNSFHYNNGSMRSYFGMDCTTKETRERARARKTDRQADRGIQRQKEGERR